MIMFSGFLIKFADERKDWIEFMASNFQAKHNATATSPQIIYYRKSRHNALSPKYLNNTYKQSTISKSLRLEALQKCFIARIIEKLSSLHDCISLHVQIHPIQIIN